MQGELTADDTTNSVLQSNLALRAIDGSINIGAFVPALAKKQGGDVCKTFSKSHRDQFS
jgi:hypothetical protein